jgi:hypothetical protein
MQQLRFGTRSFVRFSRCAIVKLAAEHLMRCMRAPSRESQDHEIVQRKTVPLAVQSSSVRKLT